MPPLWSRGIPPYISPKIGIGFVIFFTGSMTLLNPSAKSFQKPIVCVDSVAVMFFLWWEDKKTMNVQYGNKPLDQEDRLAYDFSQQSYGKVDDRTDVGDWQLDKELSNVDTAVWHNQKTKQSHVSNRGSTSFTDWVISDAQIATGTEGSNKHDMSNRFERAIDTTKRAHDKYGYNVSTSGHSLGARASAFTTERLGDNDWYDGGVGFNQGNSSIANQFSKAHKLCKSKNPPAFCMKQLNIK